MLNLALNIIAFGRIRCAINQPSINATHGFVGHRCFVQFLVVVTEILSIHSYNFLPLVSATCLDPAPDNFLISHIPCWARQLPVPTATSSICFPHLMEIPFIGAVARRVSFLLSKGREFGK